MARDDMPFDDDVMTMIMGIEPNEPGQHGRTIAPKPDKDAVGVVAQIRDLCEEFLQRAGKNTEEEPMEEPEDRDFPKGKKRNDKEDEDEF